MFKSFLLLLCSQFVIASIFKPIPAAQHDKSGLSITKLIQNQGRQVNAGSSLPTISSTFTTTLPITTVTSTITSTSGSPSMMTVTVTASPTTTTVTQTVYTTGSDTSSRPPSSTTTALSCADLSASLDGEPYTAPMGNQYNLQCRSYFYADDDNTLATYYGVETFRDCADLCDEQDGCNLFFLGTADAGDQAQECFLLSNDEYGESTDSNLADAGVIVGFVSQQLQR